MPSFSNLTFASQEKDTAAWVGVISSPCSGTKGVSTTASSYSMGSGATGWNLPHYDLNGDGYTDLLFQVGTTWYVAWGSATGYSAPVSTGITTPTYSPGHGQLLVGDLCGTGQAGLLANNNGTWYYYTWNDSSFSGVSTGVAYNTSAVAFALADTNGDGLPDLVTMDYTAIYISLNTSNTSPSFQAANTAFTIPIVPNMDVSNGTFITPDTQPGGPLKRFDFNGDGRDDLHVSIAYEDIPDKIHVHTPYLLLGNGNTFTASSVSAAGDVFVNWNNDACTDWISGSTLNISACNGNPGATISLGYTPITSMDWDGDGRTDLVYVSNGEICVQLSTGTGLGASYDTGIAYNSSAFNYWGKDINGDGLDDLEFFLLNGTALTLNTYFHNSGGQMPDLAISFTDGFGNSASPTYVSLVQNNYTPNLPGSGFGGYYPYTKPLYVASQVVYSDPSSPGGTWNQQFWYYSGIEYMGGRGFQGFGEMRTIDSRNNLYDYQYYLTSFPYSGMLYKESVYVGGVTGNLIQVAQGTQAVTNLNTTQYQERFFPYFSNWFAEQYEVGGTEAGDPINTTSTDFTYDNYGNAKTVATTTTDKDPGSPYLNVSWTTTTTNTPDVDTTNWCLGLLSETQVTYGGGPTGTSAVTRTKTFPNPDTAHCRYTQIVTEPSSSQYMVTETLVYDPTAGTLLTDTMTGAGMTARTTTYVWDSYSQFPTSITDPSGAITQYGYNYSMGLLASITDANGLPTSWQYGDGFGRKTQEKRRDGTYTNWQYHDMAGSGYNFHGLIPEVTVFSSNGTQISDHDIGYDSVGRLVVQVDQNISGGYSQYNIRYNSLGQVAQSSFPCAWAGWPTTCPNWTVNTYDALNRVTVSTWPTSSTNSSPQYTYYYYAGRTTKVKDANGNSRTFVSDVNGWPRQTTDAYGYTVTTAYDAAGSRTGVTDSQGNSLWGSASYAYGIGPFLLGATDIDRGAWTYTYDALGEMTGWKDAKGQQFSATYDPLSRPLTRSEPDLFTHWTWGSTQSAHDIGQLDSVCTGTGANPTVCTSATGYAETESYDSLGRAYQRSIQIPAVASPNNGTYTYTYQYNATTGFLDTLSYPVSTNSCQLVVKYGYTYGLLASLTDASNSTQCGSTGTVFWAANATDQMGHVTQATLGDGVVENRTYDAVTGFVQSIQATNSSGVLVQNQAYLFDPVGNLTQRQDNNLGLTENVYYDNAYRLDHSNLGSKLNLQMGYSLNGNITSKSDVSTATWTYDPSHVHRLLTAGTNTYTYDNNGNAVTRNGSAVTWTSYNYPSNVQSGSYSGTFYYGPDRQRYFQTVTDSSNTEQTTFVGGALELTYAAGGATMWRHYLYAGNEPVAVVYRESNGTNFSSYILKDHLGGVAGMLQGATPRVNESFAPFGLERSAADWSSALLSTDASNVRYLGRRGFDFQTVIGQPGTTNALGLIHMNGRVEDVVTGRFLSADPYVTDPSNPQNYNRYSYVLNNPLSYRDPSGFSECAGDEENGGMAIVSICATRPPKAPGFTEGGGSSGGGGGGGDSQSKWDFVGAVFSKPRSTTPYTGTRIPGGTPPPGLAWPVPVSSSPEITTYVDPKTGKTVIWTSVDPSLTEGFNSTLLGQFSLFNPNFYEEAAVTKPLAWVVNRGLRLIGVPASVVARIFTVGGLAVIPLYEAGTAAGAVNLFFHGGFGVPGAVDNLPVNLPGPYGSGVSMGGGVYWQEDFPQ